MLRLLAFLLIVPTAALAQSCGSLSAPDGLAQLLPRDGDYDDRLFDRALRYYANRERCSRGLDALRGDPNLRLASAAHSRWQAGAQTISHTSSLRGREEVADRVRAVGYRYRTVAENLARVPLYDFEGQRFRIEGECRFRRASGERITRQSYGEAARYITRGWMNSPGHRRNLLSDAVREIGSAVRLDPNGPYCGDIYATSLYGTSQ
ncbi:MAG: CAP domain-containing protein [Shimia sp.]